MAQTLYDKLWSQHVVCNKDDGTSLIYIDRHLIHEVTSPQAFTGLHMAKRKLWRKDSILAMSDHNTPTTTNHSTIEDPISRTQVSTLSQNCTYFGLTEFGMDDPRRGIVHVTGPEQGATLPGMTIVCGDSHTSTHGALGALAFGIGTSEVEHVMATQCLILKKSKNMRVYIEGQLDPFVSAKDIILALIGSIGIAGGSGHAIEFAGPVIEQMSIEARMTICNMAIEAGARSGIVAVDNTTLDYLKGRPYAPNGALWPQAVSAWQDLHSNKDASFDQDIKFNVDGIGPQVSWGTSPEMVVAVDQCVPDPRQENNIAKRENMINALAYMDLQVGQPITDIRPDRIFIGSCTNSRIEDLRAAAQFLSGQKVASGIKQALVVPGSGLVRKAAEAEGLDQIFIDAGFEWRHQGCSMCLAMNADRLEPGERCASTSNRNFEGRQGQGGRTHLVSPVMAAAAAVCGHFADIRDL